MSRVLFDAPPIAINPDIARVYGLNAAAFLQQLHYWITHKQQQPQRYAHSFQQGHYWVYATPEKFQSEMPYLGSERSIQRLIARLRKDKILIVGCFNRFKGDKTNWYRIDYAHLKALISAPGAQFQLAHTSQKSAENPHKQRSDKSKVKGQSAGQIEKTLTSGCQGSGDSLDSALPKTLTETSDKDFTTHPERVPFLHLWDEDIPIIAGEPYDHVLYKQRKLYLPGKNREDFARWISIYPETGGSLLEAAEAWDQAVSQGALTPQAAQHCVDNTQAKIKYDRHWKAGRGIVYPKTYIRGRHWEIPPQIEKRQSQSPTALQTQSMLEQAKAHLASGGSLNDVEWEVEHGQ